jgi:hypothetical protein
MAIGDAIVTVSCLAGLMMALPALLIFLNIAFIGTSDRAASRLASGGIVPFFVGAFVWGFIGVPAGVMISLGSAPQFFGAVITLFLLFLGFLGMASVSRLIGFRVIELNERDDSPLIQALAGALVLSFGIAFPLLGWLLVLPFSLIIGTGAVVISLFGRILGRGDQTPTLQTPRPQYFSQ